MPEGPEARQIAEKLRSRIQGLQLLSVSLLRTDRLTKSGQSCATHRELITKWPQISHLFPSVCLDVITRGKQIFFFFENGIVFNSGLGIEGHWYLNSPGQYTDFALIFGSLEGPFQVEQVRIYYDDQIRYGTLSITHYLTAIEKMFRDYGPDFLNIQHPQEIDSRVRAVLPSEFFQVPTFDLFWSELSLPRRSRMSLCTFLLSHQEYFSGVGNWILNEVCYLARIHPNRILGSISREEAENVFQSVISVISQGYQSGGLTHGTFLDPNKETGKYQTRVYKKLNDPLGNQVRKIKLNCGRTGYIVDSLQAYGASC